MKLLHSSTLLEMNVLLFFLFLFSHFSLHRVIYLSTARLYFDRMHKDELYNTTRVNRIFALWEREREKMKSDKLSTFSHVFGSHGKQSERKIKSGHAGAGKMLRENLYVAYESALAIWSCNLYRVHSLRDNPFSFFAHNTSSHCYIRETHILIPSLSFSIKSDVSIFFCLWFILRVTTNTFAVSVR